jgi:DNA polymerase elongation subunit (family B)
MTSQIVLSYATDNGTVELKTFDVNKQPYKFTKWVYANNSANNPITGYISTEGEQVSLEYAPRFNKFDLMQFIMSLDADTKKQLLDFKSLNVYSIDIETEIIDEFPDAENAKTPIVSIAVTALDDKLTTVVLTTDHDKLDEQACIDIQKMTEAYIQTNYDVNQQVDVKVVACINEADMLKKFLVMFKKMPAVIAHNGNGYDYPYIKKRLAMHNLSMSAASIDGTLNNAGMPKHKLVIDYMELFKSYEYSLRPYESYSLNYIADKSLKLPKLDYGEYGTLKALREQNIVKFLAYNAVDTIILGLLHKKHNLINVLYGLAMVTSLPLSQCEGPVNQAEAVMFKYYLDNPMPDGTKFVCPERQKTPTHKYEGGYVKDPVKNWAKYVACFDYSSLYPSIMRTMNMSPMNLIKQLAPHEIEQYKNNKDFVVSSQGRLYDNRIDSPYKVVQATLYKGRKDFQGDQFFYYNEVWFEIQKEKKRRGLIDSL